MSALIDQFAFDSDDSPGRERFDVYRDLYSGGADATCLGPGFRAAMTGCRLDRSILFERRLKDVGHERGAKRVRRDGFDHFTLTLNLQGELHADDGSGFRAIRPGEILMLDMTRPMRTRAPGAHILTMSVARDRVAASGISVNHAHGQIVATGRAGLLADHMTSIAKHRGRLELRALPAIGRVTGELLSVCFGVEGRYWRTAEPAAPLHAAAIRAFIEQNLGNPLLDIDMIVAGTGVPRATLYRHFGRSGGIARHIRKRRLESLREALSNRNDERTIAQLAEAIGFLDGGTASRRFAQAFGIRPGRYRDMARAHQPTGASRARMDEWVAALR